MYRLLELVLMFVKERGLNVVLLCVLACIHGIMIMGARGLLVIVIICKYGESSMWVAMFPWKAFDL